MSQAAAFDETPAHDEHDPGSGLALAPDSVVVRRNAGLAALVGGLAAAVAIAYLARASATGAVLDWILAVVVGLVGIGHLAALVDARTPLLVADPQGVRIRLGRAWRGLPWGALSRVEHTPRRGLLRDGRLALVVHNPARLVEELEPGARRQSWLSQKLYGAPFAVPLSLSTRVAGEGDDLTRALTALADGSSRVVELPAAPVESPAPPVESPAAPVEQAETTRRLPDPRPVLAHALFRISGLWQRDAGELDPVDGPQASETPSPLRESAAGTRVEVRRDLEQPETDDTGRELRRPGAVSLVEDTVVWGDRVSPIARVGSPVEPLLIDEHAVEPADDPVIGPQFSAARTRLGLTVDQLAERTRIRPHVIEAIEVDDFAPCGGDFYARGHLRTLARVLGVDVTPLLTAYDERYAAAPISPRKVFEAELATGASGSIRGTRGGPNWSVLVAAVMALVLAWSVARLVMEAPVELRGEAPVLNGSAGVDNGQRRVAPAVPVVLTAEGGGARVRVRDSAGRVVFDGVLAFGESRTVAVSPPVRVQTTDGSLAVTVDGVDHGALGVTGEPAQDVFVTE